MDRCLTHQRKNTEINNAAIVSAARIASAAGAADSAGSSLDGTTLSGLMNNGFTVNCGIAIENWTKYQLIDPEVSIVGGQLSLPPSVVLPSKREAMVASKTSGTATGSYGTVSWLVKELNCRVVAMWSAPFNFDYYSNWLAVGITETGYIHHKEDWFNDMYYKDTAERLNFVRQDYYSHIKSIMVDDGRIEVVGIMGSSHQAQVKLTVRTKMPSDLTHPIQALLKN